MLSTSDKLEQLRWRFSWGQVLQMFGENKQRLAQWKLKSDWARDSSLVGQNPIGRGILRSRGPASLGFFVKQQGRRD